MGGVRNDSRTIGVAIGVTMLALALGCMACATHDAGDPQYGGMFKTATRERVNGAEFWGTRTDKSRNCTSGTMIEVCSGTPATSDNN